MVIGNQSFVKFDLDVFKPAPAQGPFINTLDAAPPTSAVQSPSGTQTCASFPVSWSGADDINGSGLRGFDVYVDDLGDASPAYLWQTNTTASSATYRGVPGHRYGFYTRARDNVGNLESAPQPFGYDVEVTAGANCATFADVPTTYWAWQYIERLYAAGITGGCATSPSLKYCPDSTVTRAQMAIFLLRGIHGSSYTPPAIGSGSGFSDVPAGSFADTWIKELALEGITSGCGAGIYCPGSTVTRAQMAVFLLRGRHGSSYTPPAVGSGTGFSDVPVGSFADAWIKQLAAEGITSGCTATTYCPGGSVTRAEMAIFLVRTFNLP